MLGNVRLGVFDAFLSTAESRSTYMLLLNFKQDVHFLGLIQNYLALGAECRSACLI